jgi:AAA+ ATPase superfamily predicted ATPase
VPEARAPRYPLNDWLRLGDLARRAPISEEARETYRDYLHGLIAALQEEADKLDGARQPLVPPGAQGG